MDSPRATRYPLFFLGWDQPWLPRLAEFLLKKNPDLSESAIILPGRRAGRRLLELLALEAQKNSQLLLPPTIMTLEEAVSTLLKIPTELPVASKNISCLAWRQAALELTSQEIEDIQSSPEEIISAARRDGVAALAERLASELGKAGFSIQEVLYQHPPFFPESADREEPRWKALARLQKCYQKILARWGYVDHAEIVRKKLLHGECTTSHRVFIAGVVDFSELFVSFFEKVNPEVIVIAPESRAPGFDHHGKIIPSYWLEHPTKISDEIVIPCERSRDQATRTWEIITNWQKTASQNSVAIVAPDAESISFLREAGRTLNVATRWAGGAFFQGSLLFVLLKALQKFLDRTASPFPSLAAVSGLLRHPITATSLTASLNIPFELLLRELDDWEREHLSLFLEKDHLRQFHKEETLVALLEELEKNFTFALKPEPLEEVLEQFRALLLRLLGKENVKRSDPEGHFFLECFEKLLLLLEELEKLTAATKLHWSGAEFLSFLLEMLGQETIPELEQPQAIEIIGWLEAAAEDIPSLVLTSFHEGAVPTSLKNDPLLSERLRKRLGLHSPEEQLARDHYYLQLILASRKEEGGVAILAPRYNGGGEPVRPSRLLLQGCSEKELPRRILMLTQRQTGAASPQLGGYRFQTAASVLPPLTYHLPPATCNVTSLRTYLRSPRLFYLQHVLKLREVLEAPVEITPPHFGVLLHQILAAFNTEPSLKEEKKETVFYAWLEKALERSFQWQFGKNPSPSVASQQGELLRALKGFARAEAAHRREGWQTFVVEKINAASSLLEEKITLDDGRSLILQGRIDRLDWHPEKKRWLLLDYKTSHHQEWKKETPNRTHFQRRGENVVWHDLQLPLYLKLAPQLSAVQTSGLPLPTIENTDLSFFQLPIHPDAAGISESFETAMIEPAWKEAQRLIELILDGRFKEIGTLPPNLSPTWVALCGVCFS